MDLHTNNVGRDFFDLENLARFQAEATSRPAFG